MLMHRMIWVYAGIIYHQIKPCWCTGWSGSTLVSYAIRSNHADAQDDLGLPWYHMQSDQTMLMHRMMWVYPGIICHQINPCWCTGWSGSTLVSYAIRSNHADAQDDLGLRWYHMPSDQTMLMHRMIWVYAGIICHQIKPCWCTGWSGSTLVSYAIRSNHADTQDDLGLRWYHMPSDQTMLMHRMIWVYPGIICHQIKPCWCTGWSGSTLVSYAIRSNHADTQDDLGLRWYHMPSDQTMLMHRMIWVYAGIICHQIKPCWCTGWSGSTLVSYAIRSNHADAQDDLYAGIICHQIKPCWCTGWSGSTLVSYALRSNHADAQDDLGLRWYHMPSDQTMLMHRMIWVYPGIICHQIKPCWCTGWSGSMLVSYAIRSNHADAQDDLGLRWYHMPSDQTMLMHRMIWVYAGIICHQIKPCWCTGWSGSTLVSYAIRSNHADAQDDLGLRWYHIPSNRFYLLIHRTSAEQARSAGAFKQPDQDGSASDQCLHFIVYIVSHNGLKWIYI